MSPRHFVLLEIADPTVNAFLWSVRRILGRPRRKEPPVHITIRGPYETGDAKQAVLDQSRRILEGDVLQIAGVGTFSNPGEHVVYFKVNSAHLRDVWWKPSFPIEKYGFEPHISIYRGPDGNLADVVTRFMAAQNIVLNC